VLILDITREVMKVAIAVAVLVGIVQICHAAINVPFKCTLLYYSGRNPPFWEVNAQTQGHKAITDGLAGVAAHLTTFSKAPGKLGYRGLLVTESGGKVHLVLGAAVKVVAKLLIDSAPVAKVGVSLKAKVKTAMDTVEPLARKKRTVYPDAAWDVAQVQQCNNCYNYGCDMPAPANTSFAQPGMASGNLRAVPIVNANCQAAAVSDGLAAVVGVGGAIPVIAQKDRATTHLVALVVALETAPAAGDSDFHWYRLDSNGRWSHKPGQTPKTNLDGAGNVIADPRNAANDPNGPNYAFVTFMTVDSTAVVIAGAQDYACP
jgi:hypothetical protein